MNQAKPPKHFRRKEGGFQIFGLNRQDFIRYFFGGNASFAILILVLICVFLFLQGKNFLPEYHQSLQIARGAGIDLHDDVDKQYGDIKRFTAGFNRAFTTEYYYPGRHYDALAKTHESVRFLVEKGTRRDRVVLEDLESKIKVAKPDPGRLSGAPDPAATPGSAPDSPPAPGPTFSIGPAELQAFEAGLVAYTAELQSIPANNAVETDSDAVKTRRMALLRTLFEARKQSHDFNPPAEAESTEDVPRKDKTPSLEKLESVRDKLIGRIAATDRAVLDELEKSDIREARDISESEFANIKADIRSLAENPAAKDRDFPLHQEYVEKKDALNQAGLVHAQPLNALFLDLKKSQEPLDEIWRFITKHAVDTKARSQTAATLVNRIRGPYGIYRLAGEPKVRAEKLAMMLKECAIAEHFHPGAQFFYIAGLDALIQPQLAALSDELNTEAINKAYAVPTAAAALQEAAANPSDTVALRDAYTAFGSAAQAAQEALMQMKTPADRYADLFGGDEGKKAFVSLERHLEKIAAAVPGYREKLLGGTFGDAEFVALEVAAGEGGEIGQSLAAKLLEPVSEIPEEPVAFAGNLADLAPGFQIPFPYGKYAGPLYEAAEKHGPIIAQLKADIAAAIEKVPSDLESPVALREVASMRENLDDLFADIDDYSAGIKSWKHVHEQSALGTVGAFVGGSKWTNNSAIQDRYGLLPLFAGSFIISIIAIAIAVPIGISAAIFVNQIAGPKQQAFLKPVIEFIGTIPSIVLGFLGIAVLGDALKSVSESALLDWLPGLPIISRLNMLTAAILLAFMAIPTIFSLAEDALNNVPSHFRQGSLALGATNLQTAFHVVFPAALSGIIASILLGFGRVIGETMVVLLVAGNRISLPETGPAIEWVGLHPATSWAFVIGTVAAVALGIFVRVKMGHRGGPLGALAGIMGFFPLTAIAFLVLSFATQPSHTMTGIIAQGLGEASAGSTGWQALFMVGLVLFTISLLINFIAQKIVNTLSIDNQIKMKRKPTPDKNPAEPIIARSAV